MQGKANQVKNCTNASCFIVRGMAAYDLAHCLRITVGTAEECTLVAETLSAFMSSARG